MRRRLLILTPVLFLIAGAAYLYVASGRLHQRVRLALEAAAGRHFHRQVRIAALPGGPPQGLVLGGGGGGLGGRWSPPIRSPSASAPSPYWATCSGGAARCAASPRSRWSVRRSASRSRPPDTGTCSISSRGRANPPPPPPRSRRW